MSIPPFSNTPLAPISGTNQPTEENAGQEQRGTHISPALNAIAISVISEQRITEGETQSGQFSLSGPSGQLPISSPHCISHRIDPAQLEQELQAWVDASPDQSENRDRQIAAERIHACYVWKLLALDLRELGLTSLPDSIGNLSELKSLDLSHNEITSLPESIGKLSRLETLDLSHTRITSLPESIGKLSRLETLDLSHTRITSLPESIGNLSELESLGLSHTRITSLPESFVNLSALKSLNLEGARITSLPKWIGNLSAIEVLDLNHTPITSLPESAVNLSAIEVLDLNHTPITSLPDWIGNLSKLETLDLSDTHITSLPDSIGNLSKIETLNLWGTRITFLPDSIGNLSKLKSLYLRHARITPLPEWIGNFSELAILDLSKTEIASPPEWIGNLSELKFLNLSENEITSLPEWISNLSELKFLNLNENEITFLPDSIGNLSALESLDLSENEITFLPDSIGNLSELESLDLSWTQITFLPDSIGNLSELEILNLNETDITSLPESIVNLRRLRNLDLSCSQIRGLPLGILDLPNTCTIDLTGCPFSEPVLERLRNAVSSHGYEGPTLSYSMPQERIFAEKPLEEILAEVCTIAHVSLPDLGNFNDNQKRNLAIWLSKLSWTADWKQEEARFALCQRAVTFLQHAKDDASFAEIFFPVIEEAVTTCGDRVALSLIDLSPAYEMSDVIAGKNLNSLSQFLLKRVWPIEQLKKIAANKIPALRFFDEIEVYLGYLICVGKEKLDLDLGVRGMLYFGCAGLTEDDINKAHAKVKETLENPIEQAKFLAGNGHWQKMVSDLMPAEYNRALEQDNPSLALISLAGNLIQGNNNQ